MLDVVRRGGVSDGEAESTAGVGQELCVEDIPETDFVMINYLPKKRKWEKKSKLVRIKLRKRYLH
jgi:hypothetical protein